MQRTRPPWHTRLGRGALLLALVGGAALLASPAQAAGPTLAIVDGPARLVDARATVEAALGLPLDRPLIIQTGNASRLQRVVWSGGGQFDLGPDTQVLVLPRGMADRQRGAAALYLVRGWVKLSAKKAGDTPALLTPQFDLPSAPGVAVVQVEAGRSSLFSETGNLPLVERNGTRVQVPAGQFHTVAAGQPGTGAARPPGSFMQAVPRAFRDTLPTPALPAGKPPAARELARANYAELRDWLVGEPALRRTIVTHFSAWAREPAFRAQLLRALSEHPEWEPIVNPPPSKSAPSAPPR